MDRRGEEKLASSRLPKFQHGKYDTVPTNQWAQKNIEILERQENVVFIKSYQLIETTNSNLTAGATSLDFYALPKIGLLYSTIHKKDILLHSINCTYVCMCLSAKDAL
jgi:hypothetical protein